MGSVTIHTGFDLSGAERGYKRLLDLIARMTRKTAESFDGATAAISKQQGVVDELRAKLQALANIETIAPRFDQLTNDLAEATAEADRFRRMAETVDIGGAPEQAERFYGQMEAATQRAEALRSELAQIQMPTRPKETAEQLASKLSIASQKLSEMQAKSRALNATAPVAMNSAATAAVAFGASVGRTITRIKQLLVSVLIFNVLRSAFKSLRDYIGMALKDNQAFAQSFAQLKANMATAFQPILQIIIPILTKLMQFLAIATQYLVMFISALTGQSVKSMQNAAKGMDKLKKSTAGAGAAASKTLAEFDEIRKIESADAGGGGVGAATGIEPEYFEPDQLVGKVADAIAQIMILLGEAFLVLGAILAFSGVNIPLGITLMAIGALAIASAYTARWDSMDNQIKNTIAAITLIVGGALLVLGVILAFSGANIPLGIGLIAVGAAFLGAAYVAQWNSMNNQLKSSITQIALIVSGALLVLGAILAFSGANIPLGIGLMVVGAAGLVAAFAVGWNALSDEIKGTVVTITTIVSTALLALGAILAFTGANIPLGIGMMAVGAVGLVQSIAQASTLTDQTRQTISDIMTIVGFSLVALGVILLVFGVIPLGLGLLVAGGVSLASAIAIDKDALSRVVQAMLTNLGKWFTNTWEGIKEVWGKVAGWYLEKVITPMSDSFKGMANGIIGFFEGMANKVVSGIEFMVNSAIRLLNTLIDGINRVPGVEIPSLSSVSISRVSIPRLATGTVLPGGAPYLAMVNDQPRGQTNIEAPMDTIKQGVREVLSEMGNMGGGDVIIEASGDIDALFRFFNFRIKQEDNRQGGRFSNRMVRE